VAKYQLVIEKSNVATHYNLMFHKPFCSYTAKIQMIPTTGLVRATLRATAELLCEKKRRSRAKPSSKAHHQTLLTPTVDRRIYRCAKDAMTLHLRFLLY
jgi:hypothetical protein